MREGEMLSKIQGKVAVDEVRWLHTGWPLMLYQETRKCRFDHLESGGVWAEEQPMVMVLGLLLLLLFFSIYLLIWEREPKQVGQKEREKENLMQTPRWGWSVMHGSIRRPWDQDLNPNQEPRCLAHWAIQDPTPHDDGSKHPGSTMVEEKGMREER